jgi:mannose-1-phosphate guanylyltransferase
VKAVVLVGGEGTRLQPLTFTTPKQMLPVSGRAMIERVVAHLAVHGIDEVVLSLGYRPDAFLAAYPAGRCAGVRLRYAVEPEPLDTAGAVAFAARQAGIDDRFVVVNGDVMTDMDVSALLAFHIERGALATISLTPVPDPSRYGVVTTDDSGRVLAFVEKPPPGQAPTNLINAGTYVLEAEALDRIPDGRRVSIERETFPAMVAEGTLYALASDAAWIDAGTPATYLEVNLVIAAREGTEIDAAAYLDPGASVSGSVIGPGVVIEAGAVVSGSVVHAGTRIGRDAVLRDSIAGRNVTIGEGATIEGLTVLGDGAVVGVGASLCGARMPVSAATVELVP